jgi:cysteine desulfurase
MNPCTAALEQMFSPFSETRLAMIYELVGAKEEDKFVFTSSGAEAVNQVFWSVFVEKARKEGRCHILVSSLEDAPTLQSAKRLEELGCFVKIIPTLENGQIDVEALKRLINPKTALISVTMAHGLTGVIQPFEEIIQIAKEKQVLLHLDANYAVGKFPISFDSDYLTFSGEQIHSVKSSGALFYKEKAPLVPFILGKNGQDFPSLMALTAAAQQATLTLDMMGLEVVRLRDLFEQEIQGEVLYQNSPRLPNISALLFPGIHQEALLYYLNRKGISAEMGGAYNSYLSRLVGSESALSFSFSRMTTEEEIRKAIEIINQTVSELKTLSVAL